MKCLCGILIAAAALCCLASINVQAAQDLLVPFNDLLPPLLEAAPADIATGKVTTTTTTAKPTTTRKPGTHAPPTLFKTTKKSHYQQQTQHIKELHLIDDDALVAHDFKQQEQHLQHLLHSGEAASPPPKPLKQQEQKLQKQQKFKHTLQQSVVQQVQKAKAKPEINLEPDVAPIAAATFAAPATYTTARSSDGRVSEKHQQQQYFQQQQLQQYIDYQFAQTTRRPAKSGLPTLTPFPRHLKR